MAKEMSRRSFLKTGAAAALGLAVVPSTVLGKKFGYTAPSDKLNILGVGVGGRGAADLQAMESQNIIGLCDVDWKYADHVFKRYPAAKKYNDYRRMYDELLKEAANVTVATADGSHGVRGFVTTAIAERHPDFDYFYACGPLPMLRALAEAVEQDGQLSFEERMGCGFGACMGCSCKTKYGNKRICKEGPVLEKGEVIW